MLSIWLTEIRVGDLAGLSLGQTTSDTKSAIILFINNRFRNEIAIMCVYFYDKMCLTIDNFVVKITLPTINRTAKIFKERHI